MSSCTNSEKSNEQTFVPKKAHLPYFAQNKNLSQKRGLDVYYTLTSGKKSEKSNESILRKKHQRWTEK